MVGDTLGTIASWLYLFPVALERGVLLHGKSLIEVQPPHAINWAFFEVASTVDVQAKGNLKKLEKFSNSCKFEKAF